LDDAALYSKIRKGAGAHCRIDTDIFSELSKELSSADLGNVRFPRTPFEHFQQTRFGNGNNNKNEIWREWRGLSKKEHESLCDRFVMKSRKELAKLKVTFSKVQGDKFIWPLLAIYTSQLGKRRPVPNFWKITVAERLEYITYIAGDSGEDMTIK
jgi:hypothetical protein